MDDKDTIITVGVTEKDEYGHLWVTPQDGGDRIKIAAKRANLHPLFEQGKAVVLHWEIYRDIPYVAGAASVEGKLPSAREPKTPPPLEGDRYNPEYDAEIERPPTPPPKEPSGQETGRCWNDIRELWIHDKMATLFGKENAIKIAKEYRGYLLATLKLPYDGAKLPKWEKEE